MPAEIVATPFEKWQLLITSENGLLESVSWSEKGSVDSFTGFGARKRAPALKAVRDWLDSYFAAPQSCPNGCAALRDFLPRKFVDGDYSNRVLHIIGTIPAGAACTYKGVFNLLNRRRRRSLKNTGSPRSVARACSANPYSLVVPCHRVVKQGAVGGYCGGEEADYVSLKEVLLLREGTAVGQCGK